MSTGLVHYKYYMRGYKYVIPMSVAFSYYSWKYGSGYLVGYTLHRWIDNDWDLMGTSSSEGRAVNELPLLGHYIFGVSSVYGSIFRKYHRKWMTHWPGISTIGRLVLVFGIPFALGDGYGINFIGYGWVWFWVGVWMGLSHADGVHLYHDIKDTKE